MRQRYFLVIISIIFVFLTVILVTQRNNHSEIKLNTRQELDNPRPIEDTEPTPPIFSVSPIDTEFISSIIPLGALSPPSHVFPTDHIYFMITRQEGADRPNTVSVYSPGDLIITSIRATEHVKAEITDFVLFLETPKNPDIQVMFIHISSLNMELFGKVSDHHGWPLESEYSTGNEIYKTWSKTCRITVKAGDVLGKAGGNPGQWALDLGVYDMSYLPEQVANIDRWSNYRYLHSVCPLNYYEEGAVRDSLFSLVNGNRINHSRILVLQDIPGTAQGCWFKEGIIETYPEDPHLALVNSNVDPSLLVLSVGQSIQGLDSGRYDFTPKDTGWINREFKDITPDGNIYGFYADGYQGIIIIKMHNTSTLWVEAKNHTTETENWSFTENKTVFAR
jgi:hypothetical protein